MIMARTKTRPRPVKAVPLTKPQQNGKAVDTARKKADQIVQECIAKIVAARGDDRVGTDDRWDEERRDGVDDYTYDLAVEVRKLREQGTAWWRIGHDLFLPGAGPSVAQGKSGAAYARRLWERAWGKTYTDGERVPRSTKERRQEHAVTAEHRPYFSTDVTEEAVLKTVMGKTIHWVGRLADRHDGVILFALEARVHPDARTIRFIEGPKGRVVEFFEVLDSGPLPSARAIANTGPRRSVYLDRIVRVTA